MSFKEVNKLKRVTMQKCNEIYCLQENNEIHCNCDN